MISNQLINYLTTNYLEILGVLLTFCYLFFSVRGKIWLWVFGLLSAVLYLIVFYQNRFYAVGTLQIYYIVISIYGFWQWAKKDTDKTDELKTKNISSKQLLATSTLVVAFWGVLWIVLSKYTDSPVPAGDAFTTSMAIVGTWLLVKKVLENWIFFIISDLISIALFIYQGLYPTTLLFVVYTIMGIIGYFNWKRDMRKN